MHYAGWTDKLPAVFGCGQPDFGSVLLLLRPRAHRGGRGDRPARDAPLLGLVSVIAPILTGGNAVVVVAAEPDAYVAVTFGRGAGHLRRARRAW